MFSECETLHAISSVDDCSTDGMGNFLKKSFNEPIFKKCYHEVNLAKGAALRTGFTEATSDLVAIRDAGTDHG